MEISRLIIFFSALSSFCVDCGFYRVSKEFVFLPCFSVTLFFFLFFLIVPSCSVVVTFFFLFMSSCFFVVIVVFYVVVSLLLSLQCRCNIETNIAVDVFCCCYCCCCIVLTLDWQFDNRKYSRKILLLIDCFYYVIPRRFS